MRRIASVGKTKQQSPRGGHSSAGLFDLASNSGVRCRCFALEQAHQDERNSPTPAVLQAAISGTLAEIEPNEDSQG